MRANLSVHLYTISREQPPTIKALICPSYSRVADQAVFFNGHYLILLEFSIKDSLYIHHKRRNINPIGKAQTNINPIIKNSQT
jgi:hypothetical protein